MLNHLRHGEISRRTALGGLLAGGLSALAGCGWDGHFTVLGYSTRANYDDGIKSVYVPIFTNKVFQTTPHRGLEMELTRAVIREIELVTPFKVISDPNRADTELLGTVVTLNKNLLNRTQQNEIREGDLVLGVELVWRDLRTNQVLSNPRKPQGALPPTELPPFDPDNPAKPELIEKPIPVVIAFGGRFIPEVGESNATAQQRSCDRVAKQIAAMMEKDWQLAPRCP